MAIFNREIQAVNYGSGSPVNNLAIGGISVCLRVKRASFFLAGGLACKGLDVDGQFALTIQSTTNELDLRVGFNLAWGRWRATTPFPNNVSTHICVTFDGSSAANNPIFYLDGVVDPNTELESPAGVIADDSAQSWTVANIPSTFGALTGSYEDFRLYNRVLTPNEITTIVNASGRDAIVNGLVLRTYNIGVMDSQMTLEPDISYGNHNGTKLASVDTFYNAGTIAPKRRIQIG